MLYILREIRYITFYHTVFSLLGNSVSRRLRGKTMYHMAKGTDESSRLVSDAGPSNRATSINCEGNEEIIHQINVENPNVSYGSTENTRPTQPLLDDNNRHDKIC